MTHLCLGIDPDGALAADEQRRKDKADVLKDFKAEVMDFVKEAAYLSGSGQISNQKLDQAREDLQWSER